MAKLQRPVGMDKLSSNVSCLFEYWDSSTLIYYSFLHQCHFDHSLMLRRTTASMGWRLFLMTRRHRKSMGCMFSVVVSLFIDSHRYDRGRAQSSHSCIPKGTNLEVGYQCTHWKIKFQ